MHAHDGEITAGMREHQIKRTVARGLLKLTEHAFGVAEDIARTHESAHRTHHRQHGDFSGDRCRRALRIGQLLASTNRAPRNVMRDSHANRALNLFSRCAKHCAIHRRRRDRAVDHMIDLVSLQREHFGKSAANFINGNHRAQRVRTIATRLLRRGNRDGIEIVVTKFTCRVAENRIESKVRAVGIPLAHCVGVGDDRFLRRDFRRRAKHSRALRVGILRSFLTQDDRRVGVECNRAQSTEHGVRMKHGGALKHRRIRRADFPTHEINRILANAKRLIAVTRKNDLSSRSRCVCWNRHREPHQCGCEGRRW